MKYIEQIKKYSLYQNGTCVQPPIDIVDGVSVDEIAIGPGIPGYMLDWFVFSDGNRDIWWSKDALVINISRKECDKFIGEIEIDGESIIISLPDNSEMINGNPQIESMIRELPGQKITYCHTIHSPNIYSDWRPVLIIPRKADKAIDEIFVQMAVECGYIICLYELHDSHIVKNPDFYKLLHQWAEEFYKNIFDPDMEEMEFRGQINLFVQKELLRRAGRGKLYQSLIPSFSAVVEESVLFNYFCQMTDKEKYYGTPMQRYRWMRNELKELWKECENAPQIFAADRVEQLDHRMKERMHNHYFRQWLEDAKSHGLVVALDGDESVLSLSEADEQENRVLIRFSSHKPVNRKINRIVTFKIARDKLDDIAEEFDLDTVDVSDLSEEDAETIYERAMEKHWIVDRSVDYSLDFLIEYASFIRTMKEIYPHKSAEEIASKESYWNAESFE